MSLPGHDLPLTLHARIEAAAAGLRTGPPGSTVTFIDGDDADTITFAELLDDARSMAAAIQARGIEPGDHIAILGPTSRALVTAIEATWLCGAALVMLPLPMRMGSIETFIAQTRARMNQADSAMLLLDGQFAEFVQAEAGDPPFVEFTEVLPADPSERHDPAAFVRHPDDPEALAVLQFTSGSTSDPKGVMLSHRAMCSNIEAAQKAGGLTERDVMVSWLPLYHDMGLVGLLTIPLTTGIQLVLGAPQDFLAKPLRWMQWLSDYGGTCTAGPNFSYVLAARALRRAEGLDLSAMRVCLSGAEPVDAESFRSFADAAAPFGFPPEALFPAFGMAEVCIAGTFPAPGSGMRTDIIDGRVLEHERFAASAKSDSPNSRELAILGKPVAGLNIRVVDPATGKECRDREVGELQITGTSLTSGYYKNPDATNELIVDGWLHTGDLAYTIDGDMVMCGRIKDVIIIGGRNIYPQDIEKVVGDIEGTRAGNVISFGHDGRAGKQQIVVVVETKLDDPAQLEALEGRIKSQITAEIGVPAQHVVLVPAGTIPKTSSGKLQRSACKASFLAGEYSVALADDDIDLSSLTTTRTKS